MQSKSISVYNSSWFTHFLQNKISDWLRRSASPKGKRKAISPRSRIELLEDRTLLTAAFTAFIDPNPSPYNGFGTQILPLSTGNVVISSPGDDAGGTDAGAVYLFNGTTGELISTLIGSSDYDYVGDDIYALPNGNFVVGSSEWDDGSIEDAGAMTFGNGVTGVSGVVSSANSLVGGSDYDGVGDDITVLPNGNFLVISSYWSNGSAVEAGAITFVDGTTGITGLVSSSNSLVGTSDYDLVGVYGVTVLTNGNYVVMNSNWDNGLVEDAGAVTWGSGTTGVTGEVSSSNSLVGTSAYDLAGYGYIHALSNGNYVVSSPYWDSDTQTDVGAVTFGDGTTGVTGEISAANSLVGSTDNDQVGRSVTPLEHGSYLVSSDNWDNGAIEDAGAVTWGSGTSGVIGEVSATNSLVGDYDYQGLSNVLVLTNGNYVVYDPYWSSDTVSEAGAVTFGDGTTGVVGVMSAANSLIGASDYDNVGEDVYALTNGNYVVASRFWDNGTEEDAGAATWGNGTTGTIGVVSAANSLVGTSYNDSVGSGGVTALANGNYVVSSTVWNNGAISDAGAVTWGNGTTGISGAVTTSNSLYGTTAGDWVGDLFEESVIALPNGNYLVKSPNWDNGVIEDAGAITLGDGSSGTTGAVSASNSLVGSSMSDKVGYFYDPIKILANGNFLIHSTIWDNGGDADPGAFTFGDAATGVVGPITTSNSLIGPANWDRLGNFGIVTLSSGNFLILTRSVTGTFGDDEWVVSFGDGTTGTFGFPTTNNSFRFATTNYAYPEITVDDINGRFYIAYNEGIVLVGSQVDGFPGQMLDEIAPLALGINSGEQIVNLSGIMASGYNPLPLRVTASSDNTSLIPDPVVTYTSPDSTGSLSFTSVTDATGSATVTVTVEDGGLDSDLNTTDDNGYFQRTFVVTVDNSTPVNFDMRVVGEATTVDSNGEVDVLPDSLDWIEEWSSFWLEIWVDTSSVDSQGILSIDFDLNYQTDYFTPTSIEYGAAFNLNQGGTINDAGGVIENLTAETDTMGLGISRHLLVARIQFESLPGDGVDIDYAQQSIGPHALDFTLGSPLVSLVSGDPASASVNAFTGTDVWANPYDLNDDGAISFRDLILFVSVYGDIPSQSGSDYAWVSDFDQSDRVNFRDLILFASNYGKQKQLAPNVTYPSNYPDAWNNNLMVARVSSYEEPAESLAQSSADMMLETAITSLASQHPELDQSQLKAIEIQVVDLEDGVLGRAVGNTIYVDLDAAGLGWFVDATPLDHSEYQPDSALTLIALPESEAFGLVDLWTVIQHELGHVLGFDHSDDGVMEEILLPGVRKEIDWDESLDLYFSSASEESELLPF